MTVRSFEASELRAAAEWFACMRGPDASARRADFADWLDASEAHRRAYNRIAETFSLGKHFAAPVEPAPSGTGRRIQRPRLVAATAFLFMILLAGAATFLVTEEMAALGPGRPVAVVDDRLKTRIGEIRSFHLADGSSVTLDTDSELAFAFTGGRRDLWLGRGRARFDVAHEPRPFSVHAAGGTVVAHGTIFDVRVEQGGAFVRLLRGSVDVSVQQSHLRGLQSRRLSPGDTVSYSEKIGVGAVPRLRTPEIDQAAWPDALLDFDRVTIGQLAAEANRYSAARLIVVDPVLADAEVSGTFRVGDPQELASRLAMLLDIDVSRSEQGDVLLTRARYPTNFDASGIKREIFASKTL